MSTYTRYIVAVLAAVATSMAPLSYGWAHDISTVASSLVIALSGSSVVLESVQRGKQQP